MEDAHIYGLLAVLELAIIVSSLAVWLFYRNRQARRRIASLERALRERPVEVEKVEAVRSGEDGQQAAYEDFLREQLEQSGVMLGEDMEAGETDDEDPVRQMLAARHQFLQLELDAQAMGKDPEARRRHLVEGMQALLETFLPEAGAPAPNGSTEEGDGEGEAARIAREKQLEDQLSHLRSVIDNQHEVMKELRALLEETMGDVPEVREVLRKLADAEAKSMEMQQSIEAMKDVLVTNVAEHSPDAEMLRHLIGNQQQTITNLQNMMAELIPEADASEGLRQAIDKMQRANQELGTCITVLEDENNRLRTEVETLQKKVDELATGVVEPLDPVEEEGAGQEEGGGEAASSGTEDPAGGPEMEEFAEAVAAQREAEADEAPTPDVQHAEPDPEPEAAMSEAPAEQEDSGAEAGELGLDSFMELDAGDLEGSAPEAGTAQDDERKVNMPPPDAVALEDKEGEDSGVAADDIDALLEEAVSGADEPGKDAASG